MKTDVNVRNTLLGAIPSLNSGTLKVYSGTPPTSPRDSHASNTLLVTVDLDATALADASNGARELGGLPLSGDPASGGTASFADICQSDGTILFQASVGTSGADITVPTTTVVVGIPWSISAASISMAEAA